LVTARLGSQFQRQDRALGLLGEKPPALAIAQHSVHLKLKDAYGGLHRTRMVRHGDNALSFYAAAG
jgi:hypothetical protein